MDLCPPDNIIIDPDSLAYNGFTLDRIAGGKSYEEFCDFWEAFMETYFPDQKNQFLLGNLLLQILPFLGVFSTMHEKINSMKNSGMILSIQNQLPIKQMQLPDTILLPFHSKVQASQNLEELPIHSILPIMRLIQLVEISWQHAKLL